MFLKFELCSGRYLIQFELRKVFAVVSITMSDPQQPKAKVIDSASVATQITPLLVEHFQIPEDSTVTRVPPKQSPEVLPEEESSLSGTHPSLEQVLSDSNEGFLPATDCTDYSQSLNTDGNDTDQVLMSTRSRTSTGNVVICMCCSRYSYLFGHWRNLSENLSESIYAIPFLFILLVLPISTGFMGAKYMDKCAMSVPTPLLLFMMGILGTIIILCCMAIILSKRFMPIGGNCTQPKSVVVVGCVVILLFYCTEMLCFLGNSPSFEHGTDNYCDKTFYNFTYYLNWAMFGLTLLLVSLHIPKLSKICEYSTYRERSESQP